MTEPIAVISRRTRREGFTIVELLVASSIALIVMAALTSLFALFGRSVSDSQTTVDLNNRMRLAANRLRLDLVGLTASLAPPLDAESGAGYFELVEGPQNDLAFVNDSAPQYLLGDTDDCLLLTTQSMTQPFSGKYGSSRIASNTAEVAWFCLTPAYQPVPGVQLKTLYRRTLLVVGYVGQTPFTNNQLVAGTSLANAYNTYDISFRLDPTISGAIVPNTLADLMQRENRFLHGSISAIFSLAGLAPALNAASGREGDVMLTNVIAFDVRVFDPDAVSRTNGGGSLLFPGDPGYGAGATASFPVSGCFIDLGQGATTNGARNASGGPTILSGPVNAKSQLVTSGTATYDTWTTHYEYNGKSDDGDALIDEGTDGIDNTPADGLADDAMEHETAPPYEAPLKAIEIRIRCYEPTSKQIRQITIRHAFNG